MLFLSAFHLMSSDRTSRYILQQYFATLAQISNSLLSLFAQWQNSMNGRNLIQLLHIVPNIVLQGKRGR